jgi:hypothetical protein
VRSNLCEPECSAFCSAFFPVSCGGFAVSGMSVNCQSCSVIEDQEAVCFELDSPPLENILSFQSPD